MGPTQAAWRAPPPSPDKLPHSTSVYLLTAVFRCYQCCPHTRHPLKGPGTRSRAQKHGTQLFWEKHPGVNVLICCSAGTMAGGCIQGRAAANQNSLKGAKLWEMHHKAGDPSRARSSCHLLRQHSHTYH